jgi:hypothetical protein
MIDRLHEAILDDHDPDVTSSGFSDRGFFEKTMRFVGQTGQNLMGKMPWLQLFRHLMIEELRCCGPKDHQSQTHNEPSANPEFLCSIVHDNCPLAAANSKQTCQTHGWYMNSEYPADRDRSFRRADIPTLSGSAQITVGEQTKYMWEQALKS